MRICESSIVWWSTRWLKTDIFLIHIKNRKKSRRIKRIHNIHLFVSVKSFESNSIYKLKLFTDLFKYDENNQNVFQHILCEHHHGMNNRNRFNDTKSNTKLQRLFFLFWYNRRRYLIQANCWLRMKTWFLHTFIKNKTFDSLVRKRKFNHSSK